jgi:outer membrane lipoprotein-sorting protein
MKKILLLLLCFPLVVNGSENQAKVIINEMEELYRGTSSEVSMTMQVETPQYSRSLRMFGQTLGKERAIFRIISPKKDKGITTLRRGKEMWNFFPKINKVIKVPPSMMMGSWMGSDFTNDDLVQETKLVEEYNLELITDSETFLIILTPKEDTVSLWGQIDYLIQKDPLLPLKQSFFDDYGTKVRELVYKDPKVFGEKLLPSAMEMIPLNKPGHFTKLFYNQLKFDPEGVSEKSFSLRELKKRI